MNSITEAIVTILAAIIGVAILSVLVSRKSNTAQVIQAAASGFGNVLSVATAPVTGNSGSPTLAYPGGGIGLPNLGGIGLQLSGAFGN